MFDNIKIKTIDRSKNSYIQWITEDVLLVIGNISTQYVIKIFFIDIRIELIQLESNDITTVLQSIGTCQLDMRNNCGSLMRLEIVHFRRWVGGGGGGAWSQLSLMENRVRRLCINVLKRGRNSQ